MLSAKSGPPHSAVPIVKALGNHPVASQARNLGVVYRTDAVSRVVHRMSEVERHKWLTQIIRQAHFDSAGPVLPP